jgi:hypothetical protein
LKKHLNFIQGLIYNGLLTIKNKIMTHFQAYLLTRLDYFQDLFHAITIIAVVLLVGNFVAMLITLRKELHCKKVSCYFKITIPLLIVSSVFSSLIPTTKEAAFIYIAPAIVNNQDIQKTIKKLPELSVLGIEYLGEVVKKEKDQLNHRSSNEIL